MYFPNAFKKAFLVGTNGIATGAVSLQASGTTASLTAGKVGFFNASTYAATTSAAATPFIIAQGSYFTSDKIGPVHGGYQESVKSKTINPKYISRVIKVSAKAAKNQIVSIDATGTTINSDSTLRLRLDVKGSPALRFLNHQLYKTLDAYTGCDTVPGTTNTVDPVTVLLKWKDQITESPILQGFLAPKVWKKIAATTSTAASTNSVIAVTSATGIAAGQKVTGTGVPAGTTVVSISSLNVTVSQAVNIASGAALKFYDEALTSTYTAETVANTIAAVDAHLEIATAYVDTKFGDATFTPTDFVEKEPLFVYASFVAESGEPCEVNGFAVSEVQAAVQVSGLGESVLREMILDGRYRQEAYSDGGHVDSLRIREIEANPGLATINRSGLYDQVMVLHNVPRFNNPSSTFDNDQYLLVINVPAGTTTTAITDFIVNSAVAAGQAIALETA
jgi:hypothetical protein